MDEATVTARIAAYVAALRFEDVPREATSRVERSIADNIGTCLWGVAEPAGRIVAGLATYLGGRPSSTLLGTGERVPPPSAAQVNAIRAHVIDYDDTSLPFYGHVSSVMVPALLALAEETGTSGREVVAAYAAGFEVGARLGAAMNLSHHMSGFHCTGTLGTLAGAAASARLLRLGPRETMHALGIAVSSASGLICQWGSMSKAVQVGNASRNGMLAALLAQRGFDSNEDTLGHSRGFCRVFAGKDPPNFEALLDGLGRDCALLQDKSLLIKSYPMGTAMQAPLQGLELIRCESRLAADTVAAVTIGASALQVRNRPPERLGRPRSGLEARFNWEYLIASAIVRGPFQHAHLDDAAVTEPTVVGFMDNVNVVIDPELRDNAEYGVRVTVRFKDGRSAERVLPTYRGWPTNPLTDAEVEAKFVANCARCFDADDATAIYASVSRFGTVERVADVVRRLVSPRAAELTR